MIEIDENTSPQQLVSNIIETLIAQTPNPTINEIRLILRVEAYPNATRDEHAIALGLDEREFQKLSWSLVEKSILDISEPNYRFHQKRIISLDWDSFHYWQDLDYSDQ